MKKFARGLSALLAAAMLFSCAAFAAGSDKPTVTAKDDTTTTVAFNGDYTGLELTYADAAIEKDGLYLLTVVKDDGAGNYVPTESTILDIREVQAAEAGTVTFTDICPKEIANSAILISGTGLSEPVVVAIIELPYTPGDANNDDSVDTKDLTRIARYLVGAANDINLDAADANADGSVDTKDLTRLAKYLVGAASLG